MLVCTSVCVVCCVWFVGVCCNVWFVVGRCLLLLCWVMLDVVVGVTGVACCLLFVGVVCLLCALCVDCCCVVY